MPYPPVPTNLKILRGNPGKRPLNQDEPHSGDFDKAAPPPAHLDADGIAEWNRLVPILSRMRVLEEADYVALALLCQSYSTMAQAQRQLSTSGLLLKTPDGFVQTNPLVSIVVRYHKLVAAALREFGMSPSSKVKIHVGKEAPEADEWDELDKLGRGA